MRLLIGGATLACFALARGRRPAELVTHGRQLAAGAAAVALYQICFFTGTRRTGVALATVLALGGAPVFAGLIDAVVLRHRPTVRWAAGTAAAVVGIALIARGQPSASTDVIGVLAALGAGLGWAVYAMIGRQRIRAGLDSSTCMAAMFIGGAVLSAPLVAIGDASWMWRPRGAALAMYLGVVTIGIVYTLFGWGLRTLSAPTVVTLTLAEPVTAALLATVVLHQHVGASGAVGIAIVSAALVITSRTPARAGSLGTDSTRFERRQSRRRGPPPMPGQRELPMVSVWGQNASGSSAPARVRDRVE